MPKWWPGSGGDEGGEGEYSDIARGPGRPPSSENIVKDILAGGDPVGGMRIRDIAKQFQARRDPHIEPNKLELRRIQGQVGKILRKLESEGEVTKQDRKGGSSPSLWNLVSGPQGGPKRSDWTGSGKPGQGRRTDLEPGTNLIPKSQRGRPIQDAKRIEPGRGSDPATWGHAADRLRERRRRSDPANWTPDFEWERQQGRSRPEDREDTRTSDPMTWGIRPTVRDEDLKQRRTGDPMTWGKSDPDPPKGGKTADPMTWGKNDPPPDDSNGGDDDNGGGLGFFKKV